MTDDMVDTSDIPPLTETFFKKASWRIPGKPIEITLRVDSDVLEWFKAQGKDYERRVNAALRIYAEAHQAYKE